MFEGPFSEAYDARGGYFVSTESELEAKGRTISEYTAAKSRLAALKGEAQRAIAKLENLAQHLNHYESTPVNYDFGFLTQTDFQRLVGDLQKTDRELKRLDQQIKDMGLDLKQC